MEIFDSIYFLLLPKQEGEEGESTGEKFLVMALVFLILLVSALALTR